MQKVTAMLPSWDTTKTQSKKGFDTVWGWADKLGAPVNKFTNRIGSEAFWPTTLDKESDKAARILKSFCKDGFYTEEEFPGEQAGPKQKQRVLKKIPQKVIQNAVGLAIFTTMRTGLWISGAGGSGVLVARKADGSWSPPSGILLHTAGLGFLVGVDIYDCVVVINNRRALESFTKLRATLGGEISAVAGPVGAGGVLENDGKWKEVNKPVFTYLKSRGFYAGVQVDGTIIIERTDENARFYGQTIGVADILAGKVRHPPFELEMLMDTLKAAEGRTDVNAALMEELDAQPAPGDVDVAAPSDGKTFGIPEPDDPDPFGALALQKEGLEIREAGTRSRPASNQFEYNPSPSSPTYNKFHRQSMGSASNRNSSASARAHWSAEAPSRSSSDAAVQTGEGGDARAMASPYADVNGRSLSPEAHGGGAVEMLDNEFASVSLDEERPRQPVILPKGPPPPLPPRAASHLSSADPVRAASPQNEGADAAPEVKKTEDEDVVPTPIGSPDVVTGSTSHAPELAAPEAEKTEDGDVVPTSIGSPDAATGSDSHAPEHAAKDEDGEDFHSAPGSPERLSRDATGVQDKL